jgi:hypothetical protein
MADSFEHGNEPSGSVKLREFVVRLSDSSLFKKDSAPYSVLFLSVLCV